MDFFQEINTLNLSLQGNLANISIAHDKVAIFYRKLQLYQRKAGVEEVSMFQELTMALDARNKKCSFTNEITLPLSSVLYISRHFPDLKNFQVNSWVLRSFSVDKWIIPDTEIESKNTLWSSVYYRHYESRRNILFLNN